VVSAETVGHQRHRTLNVLKSRGMPHSDEVRGFNFTAHGIELLPRHRSRAKARPRATPRARRGK
jgi:KaiC/GvpD/RAD55 family RecA-like ATPase